MIRYIRWHASNLVAGVEPCVRTRHGWVAADGSVYVPALGRFTGEVEVSPRILARVRRELGAS